jgi:peptide deformylase
MEPVKEIVRDIDKLSIKSRLATKEDIQIISDLIGTANFHRDRCCGLAAVQIGYYKRICISLRENKYWRVLINPVIVRASKTKRLSREGCLSLEGVRFAERYDWIDVTYTDLNWKRCLVHVTGFEAIIIQHEIDHLNGVII